MVPTFGFDHDPNLLTAAKFPNGFSEGTGLAYDAYGCGPLACRAGTVQIREDFVRATQSI
jgi:hypothetical protein